MSLTSDKEWEVMTLLWMMVDECADRVVVEDGPWMVTAAAADVWVMSHFYLWELGHGDDGQSLL